MKLLEKALLVLPRTKHRNPLFKSRVIAKAKLGQDVFMDLNKFKVNADVLSNYYDLYLFVKTIHCAIIID